MVPGRVDTPGSTIGPIQRQPHKAGAKKTRRRKKNRNKDRDYVEQQKIGIEELAMGTMGAGMEAGPSVNRREGRGFSEHTSVTPGSTGGQETGKPRHVWPPVIANGDLVDDDDDVQGSAANDGESRYGFPAAAATRYEMNNEDLGHQPRPYLPESEPAHRYNDDSAAPRAPDAEHLEQCAAQHQSQSDPKDGHYHAFATPHESEADQHEKRSGLPQAQAQSTSADADTQRNPSPRTPAPPRPVAHPLDLIHLNVSNWAFWTRRRTLYPSLYLYTFVSIPSDVLVTHPWEPQRRAQSYFIDSCTRYFSDILKHLQSPDLSYFPIFFDPVGGHDVEKYHQLLADAELFGLRKLAGWLRAQEWRRVARVEVAVKGWREVVDGRGNKGWKLMWSEVLGGEGVEGDGDGGQVVDAGVVRLGGGDCENCVKSGSGFTMGQHAQRMPGSGSTGSPQAVRIETGSPSPAEDEQTQYQTTPLRMLTRQHFAPQGTGHIQQSVNQVPRDGVKIAVVKRSVVYNPPRDEFDGTRGRRDTVSF